MKKTANSNIYGFTHELVAECYASVVGGAAQPAVVVVFSDALDATARNALHKSFARLGFGDDACAFVCVVEGLGATDLFTLLEGLDPVALVAADAKAADLVAAAYRAALPLERYTRLFGRDAVAFRDFSGMLGTEGEKQRAWALLKLLKQLR